MIRHKDIKISYDVHICVSRTLRIIWDEIIDGDMRSFQNSIDDMIFITFEINESESMWILNESQIFSVVTTCNAYCTS